MLPRSHRLSSWEAASSWRRYTEEGGIAHGFVLNLEYQLLRKQPHGQTKQEPSPQRISMSNDLSCVAFQEWRDGSMRIYWDITLIPWFSCHKKQMKGNKVCKLDWSIDLCITASKHMDRNSCFCYPQLRALCSFHSAAEDLRIVPAGSRAGSQLLSWADFPFPSHQTALEELSTAVLLARGQSTAPRGGPMRKARGWGVLRPGLNAHTTVLDAKDISSVEIFKLFSLSHSLSSKLFYLAQMESVWKAGWIHTKLSLFSEEVARVHLLPACR